MERRKFMKHVLLSASLLLGTALVPAAALEQSAKLQVQDKQPGMHAPTDRIGAAVPTMKSGNEPILQQSRTITSHDEQGGGTAASKQQEGPFAPTNRVGAAVPKLKTGKEPVQTESRTIAPADKDLRG
jgi:hypothetical protein